MVVIVICICNYAGVSRFVPGRTYEPMNNQIKIAHVMIRLTVIFDRLLIHSRKLSFQVKVNEHSSYTSLKRTKWSTC